MGRPRKQRLGQPFLHRVDVGGEFGLLHNDGDIGVHELEPCFHDLQERLIEQVDRAGVLPFWIVVGKHAADVTEAGGAEDRVRDGVGHGIGVRVTGEAFGVGDFDAAEDQLSAGGEGMGVVADADAHVPL